MKIKNLNICTILHTTDQFVLYSKDHLPSQISAPWLSRALSQDPSGLPQSWEPKLEAWPSRVPPGHCGRHFHIMALREQTGMFVYKSCATVALKLDKTYAYHTFSYIPQTLFLENLFQLSICKSWGWKGYLIITSPTLGIASL